MSIDTDINLYDYEIPAHLIAQTPLAERSASKMLVLNKKTGHIEDKNFSDIVNYFNSGDVLVINQTKVVPARVFGKKISGGKVELLFLEPTHSGARHEVLIKPYLETGKKVYFENGFECEIKEKTPQGHTVVIFNKDNILDLLNTSGVMPLPPYIKRKDNLLTELSSLDKQRYQTVYAQNAGAIAAPTAGLHFTESILESFAKKGVQIARLTLHVGWGTFKPVTCAEINQHQMPKEKYLIDKQNITIIKKALEEKRRVITVGTTSTRAIESAAGALETNGEIPDEISGETGIFIFPGYKFKVISGLVTNLHLPKSTPLFLASALAGRENILNAYKFAVEKNYRFFSYGDSMVII
jgi:S-adenosylmethionine:tRNA ribosyltransferase-isomerase